MTDAVEFDSPQAFGTALITFGDWKQLDSGRLRVGDAADDVTVEIVAEGGEIRVTAESIREHLPENRVPIRLGIDLSKPVTKAEIRTSSSCRLGGTRRATFAATTISLLVASAFSRAFREPGWPGDR